MFKSAWNGEKISQKQVFDFLAPNPPPKKLNWGAYKNEKNQSCSKWPEMARKIVENDFRNIGPPTKKIGGRTKKIWSKMKKNQSCSKLREMARKFVESDFRNFGPPPKKLEVVQKKCWWKKSKLFKIAWNGKKIRRKLFSEYWPPPKKKLEGVQKKLLKMIIIN